MNIKLLKLLGQNARYNASDLATMLGTDEETVKKEIAEMEKNIQSKHGAYVNKLIGYSTRLEDISILLRL